MNHQNVYRWLATAPLKRWPWLLIAVPATLLVAYALYTQHGPAQLIPCVQCIYQRMVMLLLAVVGWFGFFVHQRPVGRLMALLATLTSASLGVYTSAYHLWLQTASNPLFMPCSPVPDFPSWLPLHEWLPVFFAAGGLCGDIDWQWLGLSMPGWLLIIFSLYALAALVTLGCYWHRQRSHVDA